MKQERNDDDSLLCTKVPSAAIFFIRCASVFSLSIDELKALLPISSSVRAAAASRWAPGSWRARPVRQIPEYPNAAALEEAERALTSFPPLVFAGEAWKLEERFGEAAMGHTFLLQGGDCAESFKEFSTNNIRDTFHLMLQMAIILTFDGQMPTIKGMYFGDHLLSDLRGPSKAS